MAVKSYRKGVPASLGRGFKSTDFDCRCKHLECQETLIDEVLLSALEALALKSGPFSIDSAFRCHTHNTEVGGVDNSQHLFGKAADCKSLKGLNANLMARLAEEVPAFNHGGVGIYFELGFVHVDVRKGPARWSYPMTC